MNPIALQIRWSSGIERVPVSDITKAGQHIKTTELWVGVGVVSYTATVEAFSQDAGNTSVRLRYVERGQKDPRVKEKKYNVSWGISELSWNASKNTALAEWKDDRLEARSGPGTVEIIGDEKPIKGRLRKTASVIRKLRPEQAQLRATLLLRDERCVLTGEGEIAALEAAHLIPVEEKGADNVGNAILLRADLHCLFDQNLFWFAVSGGEAIVKHSKEISPAYKKLLAGKKLSCETFREVQKALRLRAKLRKT